MQKTKIDWCDYTFNPVTGCLHKCEYCYARKIASRFGKFCKIDQVNIKTVGSGQHTCVEVEHKMDTPYPEMFTPTLHKYRLNEPAQKTKPQNIFVCSMADLFGAWVPDEWIQSVFATCAKANQHRYLFLTKNPQGYAKVYRTELDYRINHWFGATATDDASFMIKGQELFEATGCMQRRHANRFLSIEPLLGEIKTISLQNIEYLNWVIIGAETGNRKNKVIPKKEWVDEIVSACRSVGTPVFLKSSLLEVMEGEFIQEYPWEV